MQLITGGMGFIGLHTAKAFLDAGEDVVVTRFRTTRRPDFLEQHFDKRLFVEPLDLTNPHDVIELARKYNVTGIVHLAVPALQALSPAEEYRVNMTGLINVLEAARITGVKRLSLASSVAVYAGVADGPMFEDMPLPLKPGNPTETFKKSFEILGHHYADRCGIDLALLRIGGIFGPLYHSLSNVPSRIVHAAVKRVPGPLPHPVRPVPFEDDLMDLCYVKDCAQGIQLVQMAPALNHRVYNISGGAAVSAKMIAAAAQKIIPEAEITLQPGTSPHTRANPVTDITRISQELGYRPRFDIAHSVADYIAWLERGNQF